MNQSSGPVLIAYDGSDDARAAVAAAGAERLDDAARETAQALAWEGAALAREAGLEATLRAVEGAGVPWHAIVRCADELDTGAIVSGTRGRSTFAATVLGGTAQILLHHAHRPVLVVAHER